LNTKPVKPQRKKSFSFLPNENKFNYHRIFTTNDKILNKHNNTIREFEGIKKE
jgi:hypothetical protein